nr:GWxTD domain-containing protein [Bacteroidales bacterium]
FYIATLTEYRSLLKEGNTKRAVDEFWLKRSSSMERSRELIRVYYNRVLYSNLYFTASSEGWKTDRGMVFILFGPPDRMKDSGNEQRWYYISRRQGKVIEFVFERKPSFYSNQDLIWKKSIASMVYWSSAVSSWRSGKL